MSRTLLLTTFIAVLVLCSSFALKGAETKPTAADPNAAVHEAIEKAILKTFAEITKAAESVDAEKLFSYVLDTEKGCLISNGKITLTRQEALEDYKASNAGIAGVVYTFDKHYVTVISSETAIMAVEGRFKATTTDGRTFTFPMAQTIVFVLKDDGWRVLHSHTSSPAIR